MNNDYWSAAAYQMTSLRACLRSILNRAKIWSDHHHETSNVYNSYFSVSSHVCITALVGIVCFCGYQAMNELRAGWISMPGFCEGRSYTLNCDYISF